MLEDWVDDAEIEAMRPFPTGADEAPIDATRDDVAESEPDVPAAARRGTGSCVENRRTWRAGWFALLAVGLIVVVVDEIPDWVPAHPATTTRKSLYRATGPKGDAGHAAFTVDADADDIVVFYKAELEKMGYAVTVASFSGDEGSVSMVSGQQDGGSIVASVNEKGGGCEVTVQYNSGG